MITTKIAVLALATGGAGILGAGAWQVHAHGGAHREMVHKFVDFVIEEKLSEVGATPAQKAKVQTIKTRLMAEGEALHAEHAACHRELIEALEQDNPDPAQLKAIAHARIEKFSKFADDAADALVELHGVFTPEQRQKLLSDLKEHAGERVAN